MHGTVNVYEFIYSTSMTSVSLASAIKLIGIGAFNGIGAFIGIGALIGRRALNRIITVIV